LIEHLNDNRLTRTWMMVSGRIGNRLPSYMRVAHVVRYLLEGLSGELSERYVWQMSGDWLGRRHDSWATRVAALKWFEKAQKIGEEPYLMGRVLIHPAGDHGYVNTVALRAIAAKYPKNLPGIYRTVLEKYPKVDSTPLAETLVRCPLPMKDKLDVLLGAAKHEKYEHLLPAFRAIRALDKKRFDALLLATIEGFTVGSLGKYWTCPEAHLAAMAVESDDPRVWPALEKAAKRAPVGLRMELLSLFGDPRDRRHRVERLRFLASFLEDTRVRDSAIDSRLHGLNAGDSYARIEVRNFAAVELGSLLDIKVEVERDHTPTEWSAIRDKVQSALKLELEKMK
jgi:hypothetical protein